MAQDAGTAAEGSIDSHGAPDVTLGDAELDSLASRIAGRSAEPAAGPPRRRHARAQAAEAPVMGLLGVLDAVPVALAPGSIPSATAPVPADMASGRASATRGRVPAAGKPPKAGKEAKHYHGHRERLRDRFLQQGAVALQDYELLEMLLFSIDARNDVKPLAKRLLQKYGSLWAVVNAPVAKLREDFSSDVSVAKILIVGAIGQRMARQELLKKPVLSSWQKLLDYCEGAMSHEPTEQFRLLFLDRKNTLIADEVQQRGTVDHAPVYPREVVKRALELGATAIILVHNHPSGDPTPSRADIDMTKQIVQAAGALGVVIHDHLIIGKGGKHVSFKATGLM